MLFVWNKVETLHESLEVWRSAMVLWNVNLWKLCLALMRCLHIIYYYPKRKDNKLRLKEIIHFPTSTNWYWRGNDKFKKKTNWNQLRVNELVYELPLIELFVGIIPSSGKIISSSKEMHRKIIFVIFLRVCLWCVNVTPCLLSRGMPLLTCFKAEVWWPDCDVCINTQRIKQQFRRACYWRM